MKKRIFCLLLVVAMVSSLGMTAFAEPDTVEPAPQEPAAETTVNEPEQSAPAPETETPVEPAPETPAEPAAQVPAEPAEVPVPETETEPVPEGEPAGDVPAAGEEVPGVEDAPVQDAAPATNDGIATISEPAPASNDGIATIGDPEPAPLSLTLKADKTSITTQDAYDCWKAYAAGGDNWKTNEDSKKGYITLTLDGAENKTDIQWSVKPDKGGASASPDGSPATTCVTLAEGNVLYLMGGTDLVGCPAGFTCMITVYATVNGQKSNDVTVTFKGPDPKPAETPEPAKGVWLHVVNGSFTGTYTVKGEEKDISSEASVWVEFTDGTRKLPTELPQATRTNGTFDGWYTQAPTEELKSENGYSFWHTVHTNGQKVEAGGEVPEGIETLYAAFTDKTVMEDADKHITFYLDWNGINGMYGHCLTCTRDYKQGNNKFTAEDALVVGLNYAADNGETFDKNKQEVTWENLKAFWDGKTFKGYTFKGWSTDRHGDVISSDTDITNGMSFYAQWEAKDGSSSQTFEPPKPGPLTNIRVTSNLNESCHATEGNTMTVTVAGFPIGAEFKDLTYTVTYTPSTDDLKELLSGSKTETKDVTAGNPLNCEYFNAEIKGTSLVVTKVGTEGVSLKVHVTAEDEDGKLAQTDGGDPVLTFEHQISGSWQRTQEPTCTKYGKEEATCTTCGTVTRKVYPLEHTWDFRRTVEPTCTKTGLEEKVCLRDGCGVKYGEWLAEKGLTLTKGDEPKVVPATGHDLEVVSTFTGHDGMRCFSSECTVCDAKEDGKYGDVNNDGNVSLVDAATLYQYVNGTVTQLPLLEAGDVNSSGNVSLVDAAQLYQYISGRIPVI